MTDGEFGIVCTVIGVACLVVAFITAAITKSNTNGQWVKELKEKGIVVEHKDVYGNKHFDYAN